eukprot:gene20793-21497_t
MHFVCARSRLLMPGGGGSADRTRFDSWNRHFDSARLGARPFEPVEPIRA